MWPTAGLVGFLDGGAADRSVPAAGRLASERTVAGRDEITDQQDLVPGPRGMALSGLLCFAPSRQQLSRHGQIPMTRQIGACGGSAGGLAARAVAVVADGVSPGEDAGSACGSSTGFGLGAGGIGVLGFRGTGGRPSETSRALVAARTALEIIVDPLLAAHLADLGHRIPSDSLRRPDAPVGLAATADS